MKQVGLPMTAILDQTGSGTKSGRVDVPIGWSLTLSVHETADITIDYCRRLLAAWHSHDPATAPHLVIDGIDVREIFRLVEFDRPGLADYRSASVERLARAGADFAAITANMPHLAFGEVT